MGNPLWDVPKHGQSIWFDYIRRGFLTSGGLQRLIDEDGVLGVTSNPAIFEKAVAGSADYDPALKALVKRGVDDAKALYEELAVEDIRMAADVMHPVHRRTGGRDGWVSLEVSPHLAHDTDRTLAEARRLHAAVGRDNVMIKVPATAAGIPALRTLIAAGIPVNVTLLFSVEVYEEVALGYLDGLEQRRAAGGDLAGVGSVASFFLSRIDSLVDDRLAHALDQTRDPHRRRLLKSLMGKVAIANARCAYAVFRALCASDRWRELAAAGARPQRLLWASTSTKNPRYPKTLYVDELIGPDTVNTVPEVTLNAFRESGTAEAKLVADGDRGLERAQAATAELDGLGVSLRDVTAELLAAGVDKFAVAFDRLLAAVERKRRALADERPGAQDIALPEHGDDVVDTLEAWRRDGSVRKLWRGDASLWTGADEACWLGWLGVVDRQCEHLDALERLRDEVRDDGTEHVVLLGMGGSSLCAEVLARTFGRLDGFPELRVLDSTVPAAVRAVEEAVDVARTVFVVASKSGSTTEPNMLYRYFRDKVEAAVGKEEAGRRFVAVTDPKTKLHQLGKRDGFRHIAHGEPAIGGRFSALSNFGLVPAALMGLDVAALLESAEVMVHATAAPVPPEVNPGVELGVVLGTLAARGRDKLTVVASDRLAAFGAWLEQLVAESTGKEGYGIVPVDGEATGEPGLYGDDRVFVYLRLGGGGGDGDRDRDRDAALAALRDAGHPVIRLDLAEPLDIAQEFFRWEVATAVAGAVLGINPFNQPDVEASKVATRRLTEEFVKNGALPEETPFHDTDGVKLFADEANAAALGGGGGDLASVLRAHLDRLRPGDYFAVNAYVAMTETNSDSLQELRHAVRDHKRVATTLGYGPRFLHSTGQLHKGGPNTGVFLQITAADPEPLPVPGESVTFAAIKDAQARGDFQVLAERGRRLLRVHLGGDVAGGLSTLADAVAQALV